MFTAFVAAFCIQTPSPVDSRFASNLHPIESFGAANPRSPRIKSHADPVATDVSIELQCNQTIADGSDHVQVVGSYQIFNSDKSAAGKPINFTFANGVDIDNNGPAKSRSNTQKVIPNLVLDHGQFVQIFVALYGSSNGGWMQNTFPSVLQTATTAIVSYFAGPEVGAPAGTLASTIAKSALSDPSTHFIGSLWALGAPSSSDDGTNDMMFFVIPGDGGSNYIGPKPDWNGKITPMPPAITDFSSDDLLIADFGPGWGGQIDFSSDARARYSVFALFGNARLRQELKKDNVTVYPNGIKEGHGPVG